MPTTSPTSASRAPRLRRALGLWDLILFGMIVIQPTAPTPVYGVISERAQGHAVTTMLIAMVAVLFTAISYGRMAQAYPSAGSAFTYVGSELHPALGYATGLSMAMEYILNPVVCTILCSKFMLNFLPQISYWQLVLFFVLTFTSLNLFGIRTSARINETLAGGMGIAILIFVVAAVRYVLRGPHEGVTFFTHPFYDPQTFSLSSVLGGTALAVQTFVGFDVISTLSEEAENPTRNILLSTVLVCLITGGLAAVEVYAAQLVWPTGQPFPDVDTAFVFVAGRAAGPWLFGLINITLLVATAGSGLGSQLGAARLLYGMGRSHAIPNSFFGVIEPKRCIPRNNVLFVGVLALAGTYFLSFERAVELLNFGALLTFMGVNAASFTRYYLHNAEKKAMDLVVPVSGFMICFLLWLNLSNPAKIAGIVLMLLGVAYGAVHTRGFRSGLVSFEIPPDAEPVAERATD